jgi:hypothetical protein
MKSASQEAEARRESDWEKNRKPQSPNSGKTQNLNSNSERDEQRRTSVGEGQPNIGSNRNMRLSMNRKVDSVRGKMSNTAILLCF